MSRHALIVGIDRYDHLRRLRLPSADAEAVARLLAEHGDFRITRLPERIAPDGAGVCIDPQARVTEATLEQAIIRLFKPDGDQYPDVALLFVAGHGLQRNAGVPMSYLAASDGDPDRHRWGLSLKWLGELLQASPVRNQIVWLDTCHSGGILDFRQADPGSGTRCLIAASRNFEEAYEAIDGHHGVLTGALLKGLDPAGQSDGRVTNLTLADRVNRLLAAETQHPLTANSGEPILLTWRALEVAAEAAPTGRCPYKGLRYFDRNGEDPDDYFGRAALVDQLIDRLRREDFLAVVGVSGSGKSSAVRAGLLHQLKRSERIGGSDTWPQVIMVPGSNPLASLQAALLRQTDLDEARAAALLTAPTPEALADITADLTAKPLSPAGERGRGEGATPEAPQSQNARLILLVDQLEELFTHADDEAREDFLACLLGALSLAGGRLTLVVTLRADFYAKCAEQEYSGLARLIQDHQVIVQPMTQVELREAIVAPARRVGIGVDENLVVQLVDEVHGAPGNLPLLQDTLTELWGRAKARADSGVACLTLADYRDLGGLAGTLGRRADAFFADRLEPDEQAAARWMLIKLTSLGEGTEDTRRRLPQSDLVSPRFGAELVGRTLAKLAGPEARLLVTSSLLPRGDTAVAEVPTVEIAHEVLIRHWGQLRGWLSETRETETWIRRMQAEAADWRDHGFDPDRLPRGARLAEAEERLPRVADELDPNTATYIRAAIERRSEEREREWRLEEERRRAEEEKRLAAERLRTAEAEARAEAGKAETERQKTRLFWTRLVAGLAVAGILIAGALGLWAKSERDHAREIEQARTRSLFDSSLTHAALLARGEDYAGAREVLRKTIELDNDILEDRRHTRNLLAGYVDILGGSADKVYEGANAALSGGVAVSPDGRWLAAAGERGTLVLFDAESGELIRPLKGHDPTASSTGDCCSAVFDPEGRFLYSGGDDRRIIRWSVPDGAKLAEWEAPDRVWALAISPDGKVLASGGTDNAITLWSAETGERLRTLEGHTRAIAAPNGLAFSPDGNRLASASFDQTARIWDVETGETLHILRWHNGDLEAVNFSPDGKLVATASNDKRIVLWDADTGEPLRLFVGHDNIVFGVAFDADGRRLLSASRDNTMRLWDVATGVTLRVYQGHTAGLWAVARHGDTLYTAANDQTVRRWSLDTPGQWVWELPGEPKSAAVAPDGELVAVGFADGSVRAYALPTGKAVGWAEERSPSSPPDEQGATADDGLRSAQPILHEVGDAHGDQVLRLAYSADGTLLASCSHDRTAKLWRLERTGDALGLTFLHTFDQHTNSVHAVAFSPDGRTLATAGYDGRVGLFDVESGEGDFFEPHEGKDVNSVSYAEKGNLLLTEGDWDMRLWDLTKQPPEPREVATAQDRLLWATLRPDGRQLAAVGRDQVVTLHDLGPEPAEPRRLVGHEQTVLRAIYGPDGRQLATVGGDMTVRLWDLDTDKELFALRLPTEFRYPSPLWDFDFRCSPAGDCWIAVPLTMGCLALYRLPYLQPPESLR